MNKNSRYRFILIQLILVLRIILVSQSGIYAQDSSSFVFTDHEYIEYKVFYNWGFIWIDAARAYFKTGDDLPVPDSLLRLTGYGETLPSYDWFFKVKGTYSSLVDKETLKPAQHFRDSYEGGFELHNKYDFDYQNEVIYASLENSKKPQHTVEIPLKPEAYDVITATYIVRNLDYSKLEINDTVPVRILLGGEYYNIYIRYLGNEQIEDREDRLWNCMKFSALLVAGTIFEGGEDMFVWVTDDATKIPVLVEAKILVGSVKAYLDKWEGVKEPLEYSLDHE